jgi:hypothetical protein
MPINYIIGTDAVPFQIPIFTLVGCSVGEAI